jgi:hypothetical protein
LIVCSVSGSRRQRARGRTNLSGTTNARLASREETAMGFSSTGILGSGPARVILREAGRKNQKAKGSAKKSKRQKRQPSQQKSGTYFFQ